MNAQTFMVILSCGQQDRIGDDQDLVGLLVREGGRRDLGRTVQIPLLTANGNIANRQPSAFDDRLYEWDKSERCPMDLWRLLQNFLHIRLAEHHEKPYLPAETGLGRVSGNFLHSEF